MSSNNPVVSDNRRSDNRDLTVFQGVTNNYVLQSLKIVFILANSAGPDEIPCFVAFHLGLTVCQSTRLGVDIYALINTHVFVSFKHTLRTY